MMGKGFWKSGIQRAKSGDLRKEDVLNTNINKFTEIDLGKFCPFYISSQNLILDNEEYISFEKWRENKKQIEKTGWRMPTYREWRDIILEHCKVAVDLPDAFTYTAFLIVKKQFNEKLVIFDSEVYRHTPLLYWLEYDEGDDEVELYANTFEIYFGARFQKDVRSVLNITGRNSEKYMIRLVKDKK